MASPNDDQATVLGPSSPSAAPCRPLLVYTRSQLLHLQASPLVKPPPTMPELKQWFGQSKKDSEPSTPGSARERRFRRDAEDGESSSRPSFRSALSQPSQMGNFKHQPLRDADKERERDLRDKEGQERLRNLSDKYDRERLAAPGVRNKERDIAPHLAVDAVRGSAQLSTPPRRGEREPRDSKKKVTESSEDWRRGNARSNRDDADSGRPRERDRADDEKDDHRRTRDDRRRDRDRDADKDGDEGDDPRRWRDDGKREERMAARRAAANDNADGDKRWTVVEERDGRTKRNHRDRRNAGGDDKDKERDKDKEPAWMDAYIPEASASSGILGGKAANGELDGIQAWKKGIKDKEKAAAAPKKPPVEPPIEKPMDEIQLFRMMMKREEDKKLAEGSSPDLTQEPVAPPPGIPAKTSDREPAVVPVSVPAVAAPPPPPTSSHPVHDANSLLSILGKAEPAARTSPLTHPAPNPDRITDPPPSSRFFPNPINSQSSAAAMSERAPILDPPSAATPFNPPAGSRVLAFGARPVVKQPSLSQPLNRLGQLEPASSVLPGLSSDLSLNQAPVKADLRSGFSPFDDPTANMDPLRRTGYSLVSEGGGSYADTSVYDSAGGHPSSKGSRFAKYFDSKNRDAAINLNPVGFTSPSPSHRDGGYNPMDHRAMDGLLSKLNNSAQIQRPNIISPNSVPSNGAGLGFGAPQHNLQHLQQQQQQQQQMQLNNRLDALYDSRLDDRFVPDGMVPGLRSAPPPRSRDNIYADSLEDNLHFRHQPQPQRGVDPMYNPVYGGRNAGVPMQAQFRGGPSPISSQQQQRLPPGLANLGGRPPLEGSQFMGMPPQQQFGNNFGVNNYAQPPQMRAAPPPHQIGNQLGNINPALLGRGFSGQHVMREQQLLQQRHQQQLPPHMLNHHLQPHPPTQANGQPDLMALLMGGHRD
uniref:Uncharacterized protein n=1 Tax=Mycena chlorophos TaxID=658473 RepID=A0ABQ0LFF5_MYCCL|nr:predicted protein [Mycena chlorophos]